MRHIIIFVCILFFFSCKKTDNKEINQHETKKPNYSKELFIGKHFYTGDELKDYTLIETNDFIKIDSLSYSIYKSNSNDYYLVSIEKFLKNDDLELYKIIDTLIIKDHDIGTLKFKEESNHLNSEVILQLFFRNNLLRDWKFNKRNSRKIDNKWYGLYQFTINENAENWQETHSISFIINKDSLIFEAAGYQLYEKYLLIGSENKNTLKLGYDKLIDGSESAILEKTKDFGTITFNGKNYILECPYIDQSFGDGVKEKYVLKKKE